MKRFWPKLAQVEYDLTKIEETARHLTNIAVSHEREQPWFTEFISAVENEYKINWENDVQNPSLKAVRCILEAASQKSPPEGVGQNGHCRLVLLKLYYTIISQSVFNLIFRAMYGVDIMLEQKENGQVCPKILEFNFNADCSRVSQIYPKFYEEILAATYLERLDEIDYFDITKF